MIFKDPWVILLIPVALGILMVLRQRKRTASFRFPTTSIVRGLTTTWKIRFKEIPYILRLFVLILFLVALAGPRSVLEETIHKTEGIDIVLAIDVSGSMAAEDFTIDNRRTNRLEIVKRVVQEFINQRKNDRLGLVAFARLAYTVSPMTTDYSWLVTNLNRVELGLIQDGTAVGSAIASSTARLKNSDAKSKVIILLTDGINNAGKVDPLTAARAAQSFGIKIYTIGAGTKGYAPYPVKDIFGRKAYQQVLIDLDEEMLQQAAAITGGKYFRATDTESLRQIYKEIDSLEKTEIEEYGYREYKELFSNVLLAALMLLFTETVLTSTFFLKIP
jgi:Ca-activated chloride channel homolog